MKHYQMSWRNQNIGHYSLLTQALDNSLPTPAVNNTFLTQALDNTFLTQALNNYFITHFKKIFITSVVKDTSLYFPSFIILNFVFWNDRGLSFQSFGKIPVTKYILNMIVNCFAEYEPVVDRDPNPAPAGIGYFIPAGVFICQSCCNKTSKSWSTDNCAPKHIIPTV